MKKLYDVVIIGAGVIGSAIARYLMAYKVNVLVLERHNDVCEEQTSANSAIVHSGYDPENGTLKAKFNVLGCRKMEQVCKELDVDFKRIGSLTIGFNDEDLKTLKHLQENGRKNGVETEIIEGKKLFELEPNLNPEAKYALLAKDAGIVNPFMLNVSLMENAMDNGCELLLNHEVVKIEKIGEICRVFCKNNEFFDTKTVINASGANSDFVAGLVEKPRFKITPRRGQYILFDHFDPSYVNHVLFLCPSELGKGVLFAPTTKGNYYIGPSSEACEKGDTKTTKEGYEFIKKEATKLIPNIPLGETIREFSGVRANSDVGDFIIEESKETKGFFNVASIMSPGLVSSVAIGEYVAQIIKNTLDLQGNPQYNPCIRKHIRFTDVDEMNKEISENKDHGRVICRCEKVTKAMILDAIHRNCGARSVKGVKKRTAAGFGKCQGTFCQSEVVRILSEELHIPMNEVLYGDEDSEILKYRYK